MPREARAITSRSARTPRGRAVERLLGPLVRDRGTVGRITVHRGGGGHRQVRPAQSMRCQFGQVVDRPRAHGDRDPFNALQRLPGARRRSATRRKRGRRTGRDGPPRGRRSGSSPEPHGRRPHEVVLVGHDQGRARFRTGRRRPRPSCVGHPGSTARKRVSRAAIKAPSRSGSSSADRLIAFPSSKGGRSPSSMTRGVEQPPAIARADRSRAIRARRRHTDLAGDPPQFIQTQARPPVAETGWFAFIPLASK